MGFINATNAVKRPIEFVLKNTIVVDSADYEARYKICEACDLFDAQEEKCNMCGCYMRWKAQLKLARCPTGKW